MIDSKTLFTYNNKFRFFNKQNQMETYTVKYVSDIGFSLVDSNFDKVCSFEYNELNDIKKDKFDNYYSEEIEIKLNCESFNKVR